MINLASNKGPFRQSYTKHLVYNLTHLVKAHLWEKKKMITKTLLSIFTKLCNYVHYFLFFLLVLYLKLDKKEFETFHKYIKQILKNLTSQICIMLIILWNLNLSPVIYNCSNCNENRFSLNKTIIFFSLINFFSMCGRINLSHVFTIDENIYFL